MTDILTARSNVDVYLHHFKAAEALLDQACQKADDGFITRVVSPSLIALAQAHATLAQAAATTRMVDDYNAWKDIGA